MSSYFDELRRVILVKLFQVRYLGLGLCKKVIVSKAPLRVV